MQPTVGQMREPAEEQRLHKVDHAQTQQTEGDQRIRADTAVQVELLLAVIPPAGVKQLLHHVAGQVFQRAADHHGQHEYCRHRVSVPGQKQRDQHRAEAVNGAVGSQQKAAVDEAVKLDQLTGDLHQPAEYGAAKEHQHVIVDLSGHKTASFIGKLYDV